MCDTVQSRRPWDVPLLVLWTFVAGALLWVYVDRAGRLNFLTPARPSEPVTEPE